MHYTGKKSHPYCHRLWQINGWRVTLRWSSSMERFSPYGGPACGMCFFVPRLVSLDSNVLSHKTLTPTDRSSTRHTTWGGLDSEGISFEDISFEEENWFVTWPGIRRGIPAIGFMSEGNLHTTHPRLSQALHTWKIKYVGYSILMYCSTLFDHSKFNIRSIESTS